MGVFELTRIGRLQGVNRAILSESITGIGRNVLLNSVTQWGDSYSGQITKHAVEKGAPITDNIFNDTLRISLTAILTTSFNLLSGSSLPLTGGIKGRFDQLLKWRDEKQTIFLIYDRENIANLLIKGLSREKAANLGGAYKISLQLEEIRIAVSLLGGVSQKGKSLVIPYLGSTKLGAGFV